MASHPLGLFPAHNADRHGKGKQKMHGLALYITHVWEAAATTATSLCRAHGMEVDTERIALEVAPALAAIRTLDLEVICLSQTATEQTRYLEFQKDDPQGRAVRGLLILRNADTHVPATIDVPADRVVGGVGLGYRVMPRWLPFDELPNAIRDNPKNSPSAVQAYKDAVGGQLVMDTLLDAFAFIDRCDPTLARRVRGTEDLEYFPLHAYTTHDYDRLHPDQPSRPQLDAEVRRLTQETPPYGTGREILHSFNRDGQEVHCGYTIRRDIRTAFVEPSVQVTRDIRAGFPYSVVTADGTQHDVTVDEEGHLAAAGAPLADVPLQTPRNHCRPEVCEGWWELTTSDAFLYRRQRHLHEGIRDL
ncbi:hypothetical protein [Streptomyces sp. CS014]|uniref:hypothetical protein n=1 Tax=Streptomyces sp. CS014 TaxID=2162707 RepID=UPI000D5179FB|nr:hypothetical protein [Streptomyces sp. CS014]PVC81585.1 hypothetical protein DBP12_36900 [Streptomyces sp. CS014]